MAKLVPFRFHPCYSKKGIKTLHQIRNVVKCVQMLHSFINSSYIFLTLGKLTKQINVKIFASASGNLHMISKR